MVENFEGEVLLYSEKKTQGVYLNETAHTIWQLCHEQKSIKDIIRTLIMHYPDQQEQIKKDVYAAVETFLDKGVISCDTTDQ